MQEKDAYQYNLMNVHNIQVACELNSTFIDKSLPSLQHKINAKEEEKFWKAKKQTILLNSGMKYL